MPTLRSFAGKSPVIGAGVFLAETAVVIGDVELGAQSSIWYGTTLRGDVMPIRVGARTNLQDGTIVHVSSGKFGTTIGDDVTIGHGAIVHACTIEDGCLIGIGAIILDGARIGRGSLVGAGALVTPRTDIPPNSLVIGSPARVKRPINDAERAQIAAGAMQYVELARVYLASGDGSSVA